MPAAPDIAVVVSTFERPAHLRRCLLSLAAQRGVADRFEVVVADDGSRDGTADVVARLQGEVNFPLHFSTHPHEGFQQARCRNNGIRSSTAPYLLFVDADCLLPPDHLSRQLAARRPGVARAGDCYRIDQEASERIDDLAVRSGLFEERVVGSAAAWRRRRWLKAIYYQVAQRQDRPKLVGWNMAMWRADLERVNGFDERFRGWGCEDDDLAARLRAAGVRIRTALGYTLGYHLWHPPHATTPQSWRNGGNVPYLHRPIRLTSCLEGIESRPFSSLTMRTIAGPRHAAVAGEVAAAFRGSAAAADLDLVYWQAGLQWPRGRNPCLLLWDGIDPIPAAVKHCTRATVLLRPNPSAGTIVQSLDCLINGLAVDPDEVRQAAA